MFRAGKLLAGGSGRYIGVAMLSYRVEIEQEEDGRWITGVGEPGVNTAGKVLARAESLAVRVLRDCAEHER